MFTQEGPYLQTNYKQTDRFKTIINEVKSLKKDHSKKLCATIYGTPLASRFDGKEGMEDWKKQLMEEILKLGFKVIDGRHYSRSFVIEFSRRLHEDHDFFDSSNIVFKHKLIVKDQPFHLPYFTIYLGFKEVFEPVTTG